MRGRRRRGVRLADRSNRRRPVEQRGGKGLRVAELAAALNQRKEFESPEACRAADSEALSSSSRPARAAVARRLAGPGEGRAQGREPGDRPAPAVSAGSCRHSRPSASARPVGSARRSSAHETISPSASALSRASPDLRRVLGGNTRRVFDESWTCVGPRRGLAVAPRVSRTCVLRICRAGPRSRLVSPL